jgi:hypothetical protein
LFFRGRFFKYVEKQRLLDSFEPKYPNDADGTFIGHYCTIMNHDYLFDHDQITHCWDRTSYTILHYGSLEQRLILPTMSFEGSNKRSGVPVSSGDGKRLRILNKDNDSIAGFDDIPTECNVRILQLLDVDDLASVAQVARRFREDILHPSLPQNRTATLTCVRRLDKTGTLYASHLPLLKKLRDKAMSDQCWRFNKVKIIGHNLLENGGLPEVPFLRTLQHVRVLDLSFPSDALRKDTKFRVCVPECLSIVMPCLREIDLSNANVNESALRYFAVACPALERITWNDHRANTKLSGKALNACRHLKEIYMDDSCISFDYDKERLINALFDSSEYCLFGHCNTFLERVSLKNAIPSFPQFNLAKFVRNTPSLRWFRSDLSPENVAILQAERPEVTFA